MPYTLAATGVFLILFVLVYKRNKARLLGAWMFCLFLVSAGISYAIFAIQSNISWLIFTLTGILFIVLLVLMFGLYVLAAFLLLNARLLLKRERRSLKNSLTLLAGLGIVLYIILSFFITSGSLPFWVNAVWMGLSLVLGFYFIHIFLFLVAALLCNLARPKMNQHYIIVLGSGLINGKVPPLLAQRINRAIAFYQKQAAKNTPPVLVLSGGQGTDEPVSEAQAMKEYALAQGIPECDIRIEDQSTNTWENMVFSKKLMDAENTSYRCIYATSNYHLLRAGIIARRAGLPIDGIGSRTALYYLPNALLREYVAFFWMYRIRLFVSAASMFAAGVGFTAFSAWLLTQ